MNARGRRSVVVTLGITVALAIPFESDAEEARDPPPRPLRYGGIETNVLAPLSGRMGGQVQLAVPGPFVLVGGVSRIHHEDTQRWSSVDGFAWGMPALRGFSYEAGPRFFPVNLSRVSIWIGASFVHEDLEQGAALGERELQTELRAKTRIGRIGGAFDAGLHVKLSPLYATIGAGFVVRRADREFYERAEGAAHLDWLYPSHMELATFSPRILIAIGVGR